MSISIQITENALESLRELDDKPCERIISKLESITDFPEHYLDPLTNFPGYKLRVGDYRIIADWDRDDEIIYVVAVLERKHDYRELPNLRDVWGMWQD